MHAYSQLLRHNQCMDKIKIVSHFLNTLYVIINTGQKNFMADKIFANESRWRNWRKFSPGENFRLYGMLHFVSQSVSSIQSRPNHKAIG